MKALLALLSIAFVAGCGTLGNRQVDNPLGVTPYQAGRIFVFMDVVTEPIQPDEAKVVISQVYALAKIEIAEDMADVAVKAEIEALYPDATPEFKAVLFNLYDKLTIRLLAQISLNPDLPRLDVFAEFQRGINDAVDLYKTP